MAGVPHPEPLSGASYSAAELLLDEESHVDWLEAELTLMDQVGLKNYLAEQFRD